MTSSLMWKYLVAIKAASEALDNPPDLNEEDEEKMEEFMRSLSGRIVVVIECFFSYFILSYLLLKAGSLM